MRAKRVLGNLVATPWEAWKMQSNEEEGGNLDREKRMSTLEAVVQTTNRGNKGCSFFSALEVSTKGYEAYSSWICRSINLTQEMENFTRKLKLKLERKR